MTALQRTFLLASLLPLGLNLSASGQGFATAPVLPVAGDPQLLATADFDRDGRPDLAYLDALNGGSLHILLGNGDGSFRTSQVIAIPANISGQIDVADLNGDGRPDLVLGGASVMTLLGRGDGTFSAPVTTSGGSVLAGGHAALADFDGDGKVDIFVAGSGSGSILKGDGRGGFSGNIQVSLSSSSGPDAFAADFNGDGLPDLLVASGSFGFNVALNRGNGSFAPSVSYSTPQMSYGTRYLAVADVNGDGHVDVIFPGLYANPGQLVASLGRADGTFAAAAPFAATGLHNFRIVGSADLHGDGRPRIFLAGTEGFGTVLGNSPAGSPMFEGSSMRQEQTVLADFNGDGIMDLATPDSRALVVLLGRPDGTFASPQAQQIGSTIGYLQLADVNSDHIPDLMAGSGLVFAGIGDGTFATTPLKVPSGYGTTDFDGGDIFPFYPANLNGDGKLDLLALPEAHLFGDGSGGFSLAATPRIMGTPFYHGAVADFDGDGLDDTVQIGLGATPPPLGGVNIFMSRAQAFTAFSLPNGDSAGPAVTGDFNSDGCQDLAVAGSTHVVVYRGDCHGNFTQTGSYTFDLPPAGDPGSFPVSSTPGDLARADVDGDGRLDLIFTLPTRNEAQVLYGNGDGTFTPDTPIALSHSAIYVSAADLDGDGRADLVFSGIGDPVLLYGTAERSFAPERVLAAGFQTGKAALGDLRGNGRTDLVFPNLNSYNLQLSNKIGYTYTRFLNSAPAAGTSAVAATLVLPSGPVVYGSATNATVSVQAGNSTAIPSGFVSLQIDGVPFASAALDPQGQATLPLGTVEGGSHAVQVVYLGDVNFRTASASGTLTISPAATTLSLLASPAPSTTLQALTFTATVSGATTVPFGAVQFTDGAAALGAATLDGTGRAVLSVPALAAGMHSITAVFAGTQDFTGSQDAVAQQVNAIASSTTVTVSPANSAFGSPVLLSIAVGGSVTSPLPGGTVTCMDGSLALGTATLTSGTGTLLTSALPAGVSNVVCTYGGDAIFAASASGNASVNVTVRTPSAVTLAVTAAASAVSTVPAGTTVQLSAQVSSSGTPLSQGQVVFFDSTSTSCTDIQRLGTVQLTAAGTAVLTVTPGPGTHHYTASFLGLPTVSPMASGSSVLTVTGDIVSTATLTATGSPGSYTLNAQFSGTGAAPTGSVTFVDTSRNNAMLGSATLVPASRANPFLPTSVPTSGPALAMRSADLNGDGYPDLAMATGSGSGLLILLGKGDGTYTTGQTLQSAATDLAIGDFNGDGHLDVAALNTADGSLAIFSGVGDGTLDATPLRSTPASAHDISSLTVTDINGDGKADIVGAAAAENTVVILLGNGDGTFQSLNGPALPASPHEVIVGDFNEDGYLDLVLPAGPQGSLSVLLGNGDGTFRSTASPSGAGTPASAVAADLNGDGHLDLALLNQAGASVRVFLGQGDGTFQIVNSFIPTGDTPVEITAGDFNGDGKIDLAVANKLGSSVTLLLGNGTGTFAYSTVATTAQPQWIRAVDLNGDGRTDLLLGTGGANEATLLLAQGPGVATATLASVAPVGAGTHLVQASFGGDGSYPPRLTNSVALTGQPVTTSLDLVATPPQSTFGQTILLTATLTPATASGSSSDGEPITLLNGATVLGTCTLRDGACSVTAPALNVGTYAVLARYAGDSVLAASVSPSIPLTVQPGPASITLSVANHTFGDAPFSVIATSLTGGPFSFSVVSGPATVFGTTVTLNGAGTVVLRVDQPASGNYVATSQTATFTVARASQTIQLDAPSTAVYGAAPLTVTARASSTLPVALSVVSGLATFTGNQLSVTGTGAVVIAADQAGNTDFNPATQVRQTIQVSPAPVALSWSPATTLVYGGSLQAALNAQAAAGSTPVPGSFAYSLGGAPVSASTVLNAGTYTLQAAFTPTDTAHYANAVATATVTIAKAASTVVLTTPGVAVFTGNPVVLSAAVTSPAGTPTGSVLFLNGSTVLGMASLNSGVAQLSVASLPVGTQTLTATFSGAASFLEGTSAPVAESVQDFTVTTPSQTPVVTAVGSTATTTFLLNATGQALPAAVTFSVSGLPAGATATFSPASLPAGSTATSVTVTFSLPSTSAQVLWHNRTSGLAFAALLLSPAMVSRSRRRRVLLGRNRSLYVLGAAFLLCLLGATGCGGSSSGTSPTPLPTPKSYVVTLTATSGALQHSTTVTLQVN